MTKTQIKNKIGELEFWLTHNQSHPDYNIILRDKIALQTQLINLENE